MKTAVIDIGSNSVRLLMSSNGKTLYKDLNSTRLGEGMDSGRLLSEPMRRSAQAVADFYFRAKQEGADNVYAFATAAVRRAENGKAFCELVRSLCPVVVDVVSGAEEATLGLMGALNGEDGGILDIGGGSTEITLQSNGNRSYSKSLYVGAVRLFEKCGRDKKALEDYCAEAVKEYGVVPVEGLTIVGIGGTITSLVAIDLGLKEYDGERVNGHVLTREKVETIIQKIFSVSAEELTKITCLKLKRAEIIGGGAVWLKTVMDHLGIDAIKVSEQDNLEGYLLQKEGV